MPQKKTNTELRKTLEVTATEATVQSYLYFPIGEIKGADRLPYSLKVLLENVIRNTSDKCLAMDMAQRIVEAGLSGNIGDEVEFSPARVLFQDFTGVPVFVDLAAMREACVELGGNPKDINPQVPCDLVIDHSVIADVYGCDCALNENKRIEFERNAERYEFLKWAQASFENVRIVPPGEGICHQLNIEQFAQIVMTDSEESGESGADSNEHGADVHTNTLPVAYFDTLVGTDSHTPTANGIGVLGWGVGGIEAEAAALGQPITILVPKVIGIKLTGSLSDGVTAMDVALTFAEMLRKKGVVGCFVECFGEGLSSLSATQRACISNMTPEYGCTCTLFPVDDETIKFLKMTGRSNAQIELVKTYAQAQGFWNNDDARVYSDVIELDLSSVRPSVSGPSRPHDRFNLGDAKRRFEETVASRGLDGKCNVELGGNTYTLRDGAIAIAAVTSCTTATDPSMMIQAGLIARNADRLGLKPKPWVKTILAPGSHSTELLLENTGLAKSLRSLGFYTCGFGCMSCIGNSGPLPQEIHDIADEIELASVLSGNRNFEGRISPDVSQNYLMTPAHVVAYSLAGTMDIDFESEPIGQDAEGNPVFLRDIEPSQAEINQLVKEYVTPELYAEGSSSLYEGDAQWKAISAPASDVFAWNEKSTYVRRPPYFDGMHMDLDEVESIKDALTLAYLGDFITTDHISPAGAIAFDSPAAEYLRANGVKDADFNTYGSRRGNHEVMMRGTFANVKLENKLTKGRKGGWTTDVLRTSGDLAGSSTGSSADSSTDTPTETPITIFEASRKYIDAERPAIILAGKMYGSGSSRDWAAKGPELLGVKAVIAESFERIHRSNLIGMGILPLQFMDGQNAESLGLTGFETFSIEIPTYNEDDFKQAVVKVCANSGDGNDVKFDAVVRIDTPTESKYYENGGILQFVLRNLVKESQK